MIPRPVPPPPPDGRPWYPILRVLPGKPVVGTIVSQMLLGFMVHFIEKRDRPCVALDAFCPYCQGEQLPRWTGYLLVLPRHTMNPHRLVVGRAAYEFCPQLQQAQGKLRGKTITLIRLGGTINSGLKIVIEPPSSYAGAPKELPRCRLMDHLLRIWSIAGEAESDPNIQTDDLFDTPNS